MASVPVTIAGDLLGPGGVRHYVTDREVPSWGLGGQGGILGEGGGRGRGRRTTAPRRVVIPTLCEVQALLYRRDDVIVVFGQGSGEKISVQVGEELDQETEGVVASLVRSLLLGAGVSLQASRST